MEEVRQKYGTFSDSAALIRADRGAGLIVIDASITAKWILPESRLAL